MCTIFGHRLLLLIWNLSRGGGQAKMCARANFCRTALYSDPYILCSRKRPIAVIPVAHHTYGTVTYVFAIFFALTPPHWWCTQLVWLKLLHLCCRSTCRVRIESSLSTTLQRGHFKRGGAHHTSRFAWFSGKENVDFWRNDSSKC